MFSNYNLTIQTSRFKVKTLTGNECFNDYQSWFHDPIVKEFIEYASTEEISKESLIEFVQNADNADNTLLLGIYNQEETHIGNIKYSPIDIKLSCAVVGILIGNPNFRGKGVFKEVFSHVNTFLLQEFNLNTIELGVSLKNEAAIRAYKKVGFRTINSVKLIKDNSPNSIVMEFKLNHIPT